MLVKARYQIAYKNIGYTHGDVFDMSEADFPRYAGDVEIYKEPPEFTKAVSDAQKQMRKELNKQVKRARHK